MVVRVGAREINYTVSKLSDVTEAFEFLVIARRSTIVKFRCYSEMRQTESM